MGADPLSPIAPARIRVLLLPVGRIKRRRFASFVERIQQAPAIRLGDVSPDGRPDKNMFSPLAFPNGTLFYNFSTAMPPQSHLALSPYELFREPFVVLGLVDFLEYQSEDEAKGLEHPNGSVESAKPERHDRLEFLAEQLREQHPRVLVTQLLLMDCASNRTDILLPDDAIAVPSSDKSTSTTIKTVMCDVSSKLLAEMTTFAKDIRSSPRVKSPESTSNPSQVMLQRHSSLKSQGSRPESPAPGATQRSTSHAPLRDIYSPPSSVTGESTPSSPSKKDGPPTSFDEIANAAMTDGTTRSNSRAGGSEGARPMSHDRTSLYGSGPVSTPERAKNIGKARSGIVIGAIFLMAGHWSDAWRELQEHTAKAKSLGDHLWHSKGIELLLTCMLLFSWAGFDFQIPYICHPGSDRHSKLSFNDAAKDGTATLGVQDPVEARQAVGRLSNHIPDIVPWILGFHMYSSETLPQLAYSEIVLRLVKMLALLLDAGGELRDETLNHIVHGSSLSPRLPRSNSRSVHGLSKSKVAEMLFKAHPVASSSIPLADAVSILSGMASILSILQLERKKAIVLKELIAVMVPALLQARKVGAAEMGIHPAASLSLGGGLFDSGASSGRTGIEYVLYELQTTYAARAPISQTATNGHVENAVGILEKELQNTSDLAQLLEVTIDMAARSAGFYNSGSRNLKIDILRACIDFCDALPDLPGIVHSAALLLRTAGPHAAVLSSQQGRHVSLSNEEQVRLLSNMSRASNAADKAGLRGVEPAYWDDFLVRNVQVLEDDNSVRLIEHAKSDLKPAEQSSKTPFLYDPFAKKTNDQAKEGIIVAGEPIKLLVTVQNPYGFEIIIQHIGLATANGPEIDIHQELIYIGPYRMQDLVLNATASSSGKLKIEGCFVTICGCKNRFFPIYLKPWTADAPVRIKADGLPPEEGGRDEQLPDDTEKGIDDQISQGAKPSLHTLSLTVIEAQPQVVVEWIGLGESALMVLEGEQKSFRIVLRNASSVPTDLLHVSFEDSLRTSIQSTLGSKEVSKADMHELEHQLLYSPALAARRLDDGDANALGPGETARFEISITGRPGLSSARVLFDFARVGQMTSEGRSRFFTRQLAVPINITVNASIQLHRIDLSPFPSYYAWKNQHMNLGKGTSTEEKQHSRRPSARLPAKGDGRFRTLLDRVGLDSADEEHCLVLIDLRNAWPKPLTVSLDVREPILRGSDFDGYYTNDWKRAYTVHEVIHPGQIARLVLLVPTIFILNPHAQIPALSRQSERQFVVSTANPDPEAERAAREAFWFREEMLKHLRGTWKEEGTEATGEINLRGVRLSARMIEMIRVDDMDITITIVAHTIQNEDGPESMVSQIGSSRFEIATDTFLTLRTKLRNRSSIPVEAVLRIQPSLANQNTQDDALHVGRKFLWTGLLQRKLPIIPPGETVEMQLGFCVVKPGHFEVAAIVEEVAVPRRNEIKQAGRRNTAIGDEGLRITERRVWRTSTPCQIFARDIEEL